MRKLLLLVLCAAVPFVVWAQRYDISGKVLVKGTDKPIGQAVVELSNHGLWAVADNEGHFMVKGVPAGRAQIAVSCLGYVTTLTEVDVRSRLDTLRLYAPEDNLTLESVVVTAKEAPNSMATSRTIGGTAIDHLQMVNASDISSLLPGGKTVNPNLLNDNIFSLRDGGSSAGNASFGTAVEVDGVRLSTNAAMGSMSGASTRNIASTNIESVEVVTGVPSAEYGDISSGMIKLKTRKGKTPYTVVLSTNPRTKQVSASKGFDLGKDRGVLNTSVEYTRATKDPVSPYTSYSRTGISLSYQNTFAKVLRFDLGVNGNIGGMNSEDDPDAQKGDWEKARDNALRVNTALKWQLNRKWITSVDFDASLNYEDNLDRVRTHVTQGSVLQAVHAPEQGYYIADMLPRDYLTTQNIDSKELDYAASLKATWVRSWGDVRSSAKLGVAWRAEGNVGEGEYYDDLRLAPNGYRPRPYTDIPYMHNLAGFIEEMINIPLGSTSLQLMAGLRVEKTFIKNTEYKNTTNLSPRFNVKYRIAKWLTVRGGWGITEKLPSFNVLYPAPKYRDLSSLEKSYNGTEKLSVYYTQPYELLYNPELRWQRNRNAEVGIDLNFGGTSISLVGYFNRTRYPYELTNTYNPLSYWTTSLPSDLKLPANPLFKVDSQTGDLFLRDGDDPESGWNIVGSKQLNRTFARNTMQINGSPVDRMGLEFVVEFPRINPIRTELRLDGSYGYSKYVNQGEATYYPSTMTGGKPYPYVGIYPDNGGSQVTTHNGCTTQRLDANLTATTHIPSIRMVISLRFEATLLRRQQNLSEYDGREYAFNIDKDGNPSGGSVYDGNSFTAIWPVAYLDLDGNRRPFTEAEMNDSAFRGLMLQTGNAYTYRLTDYNPYFSANLSVTKEIGNHVSISFYANNFTNARKYVRPYRDGTAVVFTPDFYYGLTLRLKF